MNLKKQVHSKKETGNEETIRIFSFSAFGTSGQSDRKLKCVDVKRNNVVEYHIAFILLSSSSFHILQHCEQWYWKAPSRTTVLYFALIRLLIAGVMIRLQEVVISCKYFVDTFLQLKGLFCNELSHIRVWDESICLTNSKCTLIRTKKYLILYCSTSWISNTSDLVLE